MNALIDLWLTDDVVVTGILFAKWKPMVKDVRCDLVLTLRANFFRKTNKVKSTMITTESDVQQFEQFWTQFQDNPLKGRNLILQGICPQVFGLFTVKLAVALTLIGGVQHVNASGARVRGESHLLLVGDPGTGKSQFLKYAIKLSNRAVLTTGLGSTSAGLTVTAVKDGGEWVLEAGALVLADGGLCCIDEFSRHYAIFLSAMHRRLQAVRKFEENTVKSKRVFLKGIREPDRATIHEAMEQQTISVAKAGLVRTLNTRTTVFGVTNPKGHYDPSQSLTVNTALSGPLLSRFDIILVLLDTKNPEWDDIVSAHILQEHSKPSHLTEDSSLRRFWTVPMLKSYIQYVKTEFMPVLTTAAEQVIMCYYQLQRRSALENAARTTVRMLESLIRLAQAHARLMFRREALRADAIAAVICIESSMTTSAILDNVGNALHSTFADNPDEEYAKQEQIILAALNLDKADDCRRASDPKFTEKRNGCTTGPSVNLTDRSRPREKQTGGVAEECLVRTQGEIQESPSSTSIPCVREVSQDAPCQRSGATKLARHSGPERGRLAPNSTQTILEKLKSREKMDSSKKRTQNRTEEILLSTQYSLP